MGTVIEDLMAKQDPGSAKEGFQEAAGIYNSYNNLQEGQYRAGENQRANELQPAHLELAKQEIAQRQAELQLKQQEWQQKYLEVQHQQWNHVFSGLQGYALLDDKKSGIAKLRWQRVENMMGQLGGSPPPELKAQMDDPAFAGKLNNSLYEASKLDPAGQYQLRQAMAGFMDPDKIEKLPEEMAKQIREIQKQQVIAAGRAQAAAGVAKTKAEGQAIVETIKNAGKMDVEKEKNKGAMDVTKEKGDQAVVNETLKGQNAMDVQKLKNEGQQDKNQRDLVQHILPNQEKDLRQEVQKIYQKYDPQITTIKNIRVLTSNDEFLRTGVGQVAAIDAVVKAATGSGRANVAQYTEFKGSEGYFKSIMNKAFAAVGEAKADGSGRVDLGKFLSKQQLKDFIKVAGGLEKSQMAIIQKEASPIFNSYKDFKERADAAGYKTQGANVMDQDLFNSAMDFNAKFKHNDKTDRYEPIQPPGASVPKTSGKKGGGLTPQTFYFSDFGIDRVDRQAVLKGIRAGGTLEQLNAIRTQNKQAPLTQKQFQTIKKVYKIK